MEHCQSWESPPLIIYKDQPPAQYANAVAGMYAWVQPGQKGWTPDGSNWGEQYLDYFYKNMRTHHPDKITVGAAWPGFDDSAASWGLNRHMASRCGKTFEDTLHLYTRYFDASHPLPFVMIETWNDYEEGTELESGIDNCLSVSASVSGTLLQWNVKGNENTVDHYVVYFSSDNQNLVELDQPAVGVHALDLGSYRLASGSLFVQAVGKPSMKNQMSGPAKTPW